MIFYFSEFKVPTQAKRRSEIKHQKSSKKKWNWTPRSL